VNKSDLGPRDFLVHILEATDKILRYTHRITREQFLADSLVQDGVIRNIEIIGEASNNLLEADPEIAMHHPSIPFAHIYGMRNRVAHGYFSVSLPMIWDTVEQDIPKLQATVQQVLSETPSSD
jgi:uncharacterized protein with HEPN domain